MMQVACGGSVCPVQVSLKIENAAAPGPVIGPS
jgi:hypothetical protein